MARRRVAIQDEDTMTSKDAKSTEEDGGSAGLDTGNPADALPARTTPTWEIEVLLSGASAFALFQVYDGIQEGLFDLIRRLSPEMVGLATALGTYLMAGVMALALGFIAHLAVRAFWAAAVGLYSIDPTGTLTRTNTVGPLQRALISERWARMPQRIADLDDWATIVFAVALGLAKMMIGLIIGFVVVYALGTGISSLSGGAVGTFPVFVGLFTLMMGPYLVATIADGQRGKKNLPPSRWTARLLAPYVAIGMTPEHNLGLQMMVHRLSSGKRSYKGVVATMVLTVSLLLVVIVVPVVQRVGVGTLLRGEFPSVRVGQPQTLRATHYLDRLPDGEVLRAPVIASEVARPPFLRLFIPHVAHWHDALLGACIDALDGPNVVEGAPEATDWRVDKAANAAVLGCIAKALPVTLDGVPVTEPWVFAEDRRSDVRGFVVMIDVRSLPHGRHELAIKQPEAALFEGEIDTPWLIPFWR